MIKVKRHKFTSGFNGLYYDYHKHYPFGKNKRGSIEGEHIVYDTI